jgi:hypothetical protein
VVFVWDGCIATLLKFHVSPFSRANSSGTWPAFELEGALPPQQQADRFGHCRFPHVAIWISLDMFPPFSAGSIPESLGQLEKLEVLRLEENPLTGQFLFIF